MALTEPEPVAITMVSAGCFTLMIKNETRSEP